MNARWTRVFLVAVLLSATVPLQTLRGEEPEFEGRRLPLIEYEQPSYPLFLRLRGVKHGFATVWLTIDPAGRLIDAYPTEFSHKRFADSSLDAIREWKFKPDESGANLPRLYSVRINYEIEGLLVVVIHADERPDDPDPLDPMKPTFESVAFTELDSDPKPIHTPMPVYPEALKPERKAGEVEIFFHVDPKGRVRVPFVTRSDDPLFAEEAIKAVSNWSFSTPKQNGRPVSAYSLHKFTFGPKRSSNS